MSDLGDPVQYMVFILEGWKSIHFDMMGRQESPYVIFRIVGGKEVNPKYKLPYQVLVSVSLSNQVHNFS